MKIIKGDNATKFEEFIYESKRHCFAFYLLLNTQGDEFYSKYENEILGLLAERVDLLEDMNNRLLEYFYALPCSVEEE